MLSEPAAPVNQTSKAGEHHVAMSYVMVTRNKLPFLKQALPRLIAARQPDEEIIVLDGASTDGSADYLSDLYGRGQIQQFRSEPDRGEAHGWNKALFLARGELIKLISDDDVFDWNAIRECRDYLMKHSDVDLIASNGGSTSSDWSGIGPMEYDSYVDIWKSKKLPFAFCGLGLMIRRASLPLTGLFHTGFARVDAEFGLRVTSGPAVLKWYTGSVFVRILNEGSSSNTRQERINKETRLLEQMYPGQPIRTRKSWSAKLGKKFAAFRPDSKGSTIEEKPIQSFNTDSAIAECFERCEEWLKERNAAASTRFM